MMCLHQPTAGDSVFILIRDMTFFQHNLKWS